MITTDYHVKHEEGVWKVFKEGWTIPSMCADTRAQAIRFGRTLAHRSGGEVLVHPAEEPDGQGDAPGRSAERPTVASGA